MNSRLRIVVSGLIAQYPLGGVSWDYLQYAIGLARMGHDVYYLEDTGFWPYNPQSGGLSDDGCRYNVEYLAALMKRFGFEGRWMFRHDYADQWYGMSEKARREVIANADMLLNVSGCLVEPSRYRDIKQLVFIDSDPVFTQVKLLLGYQSFREQIDQHDILFTFAENINHSIPDSGDLWHPTRQPVVLDEWEPVSDHREVFTTVMNWTSYESLEFNGIEYGQKDVEFENYMHLPDNYPPGVLEVAVNDGKTNETPRARLRDAGWNVVRPADVCANVDSYRDYIRHSCAEWSVAKNGYVVGKSGWFSCRSACYLAAARPVAVQDTGFSSVMPTGEGVIAFSNYDEALAAIDTVRTHPQRHSDAARSIAETRFSSDVVLTDLIDGVFRHSSGAVAA